MQSNWTSCFRGQVDDFRPFGRILVIAEEGKALTGGDMIVVGNWILGVVALVEDLRELWIFCCDKTMCTLK